MTSYLYNRLCNIVIMKNFTKVTNIVVANKNQSIRATIPSEIVKMLEITTNHRLKWTLNIKTEQIILELLKD